MIHCFPEWWSGAVLYLIRWRSRFCKIIHLKETNQTSSYFYTCVQNSPGSWSTFADILFSQKRVKSVREIKFRSGIWSCNLSVLSIFFLGNLHTGMQFSMWKTQAIFLIGKKCPIWILCAMCKEEKGKWMSLRVDCLCEKMSNKDSWVFTPWILWTWCWLPPTALTVYASSFYETHASFACLKLLYLQC